MKRVGPGSAEQPERKSDSQVALAMVATGASGLLVLISALATQAGAAGGTLPTIGGVGFVDTAILGTLLFGLHRRSRACAVILFLYFVASRMWLWVSVPDYVGTGPAESNPGGVKILMFDLLASGMTFFGIVGTVKHHRDQAGATSGVARPIQ